MPTGRWWLLNLLPLVRVSVVTEVLKEVMSCSEKFDKHDGVPAYIQIMNIVKRGIMLGRLENGDKFWLEDGRDVPE